MKYEVYSDPVTDYVNEADWYRFDIDTLCEKLGTDKTEGLSDESVKIKKAEHGKNDIFPADSDEKDNAPKTAFSVLSVLLIICLCLSGFLLSDRTAVYGIILTLLGYAGVLVMFFAAKRFISRLSDYSVPEVKVKRGGRMYRIRQTGIVQGDLIYLSEGDLVPCDGRLVSASGLRVLEKNISGGDGVKDPEFRQRMNGLDPEEQKNMVFARSAVSAGSCVMIACDTGSHTLPVRRGIKAKSAGSSSLDIFTTVAKLSRIYAIICSAVIFVITALSYVRGGESNIFTTFLLMISVAASSYCELLCAIAYIAVSYGIAPTHDKRSEYNTGVIIKNLSAIKNLRELTCLIVPKSGGICERRIAAEKIYTNDRELQVCEENADKLRRTVYIALSTFGGRENHAKSQTAQTQEQDGVIALAAELGITADETEQIMEPLDYSAGDGERLFDTALVAYKGKYMLCVRGSAIQIVNRCSRRISNGTPVPLFSDGVSDLLAKAAEYESMAYRVIAVATKPYKYNNLDRTTYAEDDLCFEGLIVMREPFSEDCAEVVGALEKNGIKTVMFCDDMTAQSVHLAEHLGICRDESRVLSAPEFVSSNLNIIDLKMMSYRLFRGLGNRQKRYVADSYLAAGEHIGVIGQHLYDLSLMNGTGTVGFAANLTLTRKKSRTGAELQSSSYSSEGSEALKRAADVVIKPIDRSGEGGIKAAYEAILTSRKVCNNVRNIICYILASNSARLLISLLTVFAGVRGLTPVQMIFSGIVMDLIAMICMSTANNRRMSENEDLLKKAHETRAKTVIMSVAAGVFCGLLAVGGSLLTIPFGLDDASACSVCFMSLLLMQLCGCFELMRGRYGFFDGMTNIYIIAAIIICEYTLLSAVFPSFFAAYLTGTAYVPGVAICFIAPALLVASCAVIRAVANSKFKK